MRRSPRNACLSSAPLQDRASGLIQFPKHSEITPTRRTAVSLVLLDPCDPPGDAGVVMSNAEAASPRSTSYSVGAPL